MQIPRQVKLSKLAYLSIEFGGNQACEILMAATVGVPPYACGGGTIPLLQQWLWEGMSLGSASAFMITGTATKITNLGALKIVMGMEVMMKTKRYLACLLMFAVLISLTFEGNGAVAMAKSKKTATVKSVSLKIGNKKVTKKTYRMKRGEKKKLKVTVTPKKAKKSIRYKSGNQKVVTVSKKGTITVKGTGTAIIRVTVKSGKKKKTTWVKIKVIKSPKKDEDAQTTQQPATPIPVSGKKSIVAYFSCTDNTKTVAEYIKESTASDIYRIQPSEPYTSADLDYNNSDSRTSRENRDAAARPGISGSLPSLDAYEVVYLGYPIWHGQAPKIMYTFVESYDLSGKIIIPFCTSASSGIGTSATNLQTVTKGNATWIAGQRFAGNSSKSVVEQWIQNLDLSKTTTATGTLVTPAPNNSTQTPSATQPPEITVPPSVTENPIQTPEPTDSPNVSPEKKNIVVYFSCTDNTKKVAEYIAESADADIYRIEAAEPYTSADLDYNDADSRTSKENRDAAARPEIAGELPSLEEYTNIYIGYPIWHGQAPKILYTFVEHYNLSGKTVIPFCTSASSGVGTSATNLQTADSNQATWLAGKRFSGSTPKTEIESWVSGLGLLEKQSNKIFSDWRKRKW